MAERQELQVVLRTVTEGQGAQQTAAGLRQVRQEAAATTAQQQRALSGLGQGLTSVRGVAGALGLAVTAAEALKRAVDLVSDSLGTFAESQRTARAVAAAYGDMTSEVNRFALALGASAGFTDTAIKQSLLTVRTLSQNYQLSIEQTKDLIKLSADLASVYGLELPDAVKRTSDAIRGEAEASELLGLTLGEVFLRERYRQQGLAGTFDKLNETERAQFRLNEATRQAAQFSGLATEGAKGLAGAQREANRASDEFQKTLGSLMAPAAETATKAMSGLTKQLTEYLFALDKIGEASPTQGLEGARQKIAATQPTVDAFTKMVDASLKRQPVADLARPESLFDPNNAIPQTAALALKAPSLRELAYLDQRDAAVRDLISAQREELDLKTQLAQMEREHGAMAQRRYQIELASIAAQQRALPAQMALQDTERAIERARLVLGIRGTSAAERSAARAQIRDLTRNVAPGQRLAAFDAETGVLGARRQETAFDLSARIAQISVEQAIAAQGALIDAAAARTDAQQQVLGGIIQQAITDGFVKAPPTKVAIQVMGPDGQVTYEELIEATDQAQMPPVVRVSGVRR